MNNIHRTLALGLAVSIPGLSLAASSSADAPAKLSFNEHIQPILSEYCYHCHGLDSGSRKAGLRLDRAEYALTLHEKNGPAIIPGKPDESPFIKRITSTDEKLKMPPAEAHKTVRPGEIAALHRWIAEGAEYQEHWAFIAPTRPTVPAHASEETPSTPLFAPAWPPKNSPRVPRHRGSS